MQTELAQLVDAMDLSDGIRTAHGYVASGIEALCLTLARFRSAADQYALVKEYNRSQAAISSIVNETVVFLDDRWSKLLAFDHKNLFSPDKLEEYAQACTDAGSPLTSLLGFMDCTVRRACKPTWFQRQAYSGHKHWHGLKYQAITLPNGFIAHLYGPLAARHNDLFLLGESRIMDWLAKFAVIEYTDEGLFYHVTRRFQFTK